MAGLFKGKLTHTCTHLYRPCMRLFRTNKQKNMLKRGDVEVSCHCPILCAKKVVARTESSKNLMLMMGGSIHRHKLVL